MANKKRKIICKKKPFTLKAVKGFLTYLQKKGYKEQPWRSELAYYKCDECGFYHTTSKLDATSNTVIKNKSFFDFQKENWRSWLQNKSSKKGNIG